MEESLFLFAVVYPYEEIEFVKITESNWILLTLGNPLDLKMVNDNHSLMFKGYDLKTNVGFSYITFNEFIRLQMDTSIKTIVLPFAFW